MGGSETHVKLYDWNEIAAKFHKGAILIGNGLSQNISTDFSYDSLYETACDLPEDKGLSREDKEVFNALSRSGQLPTFEAVLEHLWTAIRVLDALGEETRLLNDRYQSIRAALAHAVHSVHVEHYQLDIKDQREHIRESLKHFKRVYTTNYDLILYWSIGKHDFTGFHDFFGEGPTQNSLAFDRYQVRRNTSVGFLHGGLHLFTYGRAGAVKKKSQLGANLLQDFPEPPDDLSDSRPLIVTEGTSDQKLDSIYDNGYLSFIFNRFATIPDPLVVFGHSLGSSDQHLVDAIKSMHLEDAHEQRKVAKAVTSEFTGNALIALHEKYRTRLCLHSDNLLLFRAATHPLGSTNLSVDNNEENA